MVYDEAGFAAVCFFYVFLFRIINFCFILSSSFGIIGGKLCGFFKSPVRECIAACFHDNMGTGDSFGVEPPVVAGGKAESQIIVLEIIFTYINMVSVTADIMERTAGDFHFFVAAFPADVAIFNQFFPDLNQVLFADGDVKGGAYGGMSGFGRSGEGDFVSYRDPNLAETNQVYEQIVEYLAQFDVDERDMTKYVIGTISALDTPLTPSDKGARGLSAYLSGVTNEMLQKERDQILAAECEDIRALSKIVKAILDTKSFCVVGNDEKVENSKQLFGEVKNLYRG